MANWRFGAFPKLPYSTMQQLNLDWILDRIRRFLPDTGTIGQVLTRTKDGAAWQDAAAGGGAVDSVNGQTGDVVLDAEDVGALPDSYTAPVISVNGMTGAVVIPTGGAVDSVNGQTGAVVLDAEDVGALPDTYNPKVAVALCESSGSASAKVATCYGFRFQRYTIFQITFTNSNSYAGALTLNINGTGSYPLWINGAGSGSSNHTLPAGTYLCSIDGNARYQIRNDGIAPLQAYGNYSASNPPPYPVRSVNGKTGAVSLDADDVGALPDTYTAPVTSVNGQTGDVVVQAGGTEIAYEDVNLGSATIASRAVANVTGSIAKTGYTPIGVICIDFPGTTVFVPGRCEITGNSIDLYVYNTHASASRTSDVVIRVLYIKN